MVKPYFYVSGSKSGGAAKHRTSAVKIIQAAVKARRRRPAKASSRAVQKLSRSVNRLKIAQNGQPQMSRQICAFTPTPPDPIGAGLANTVTATRPLLFLHQAISVDTDVWSLNPLVPAGGGAATMEVYAAGAWEKQPFPVTQPVGPNGDGMPPSYNKFDQLQYWGESEGVQNKYYHSSTEYTMNIVGQGCTGYVDVFLIHPKRSFNPSAQQDISLPLGLPGFTHLTQGEFNNYAINPQYFTCKRIKRKYFNTAAPAGATPEERELQTNPNFDIKFRVVNHKSRRLIKAPESNSGTAVLDSTDIPYRKQDWILISSSIANRDSTDDNNIRVLRLFRTCHWRDYYGAST